MSCLEIDDQIELLFRISQPNETGITGGYSTSHQSQNTSGGGSTSSTLDDENGNFWNEVGLKTYQYSRSDSGGQRHKSYSQNPPNTLHLVNVLRLSIDCPDPDVRLEARNVLNTLKAKGVYIPRPLYTCPSNFIPPLKCPKICGTLGVNSIGTNKDSDYLGLAEEIISRCNSSDSMSSIPNETQNPVGCDLNHDKVAQLLSETFLTCGRIEHAIQLMAYHEDYLEVFLRTQHFLLRGDGPLPFTSRHYIAIMAAARFQCTYLMELQKREFLYQGGDPRWLKGLEFPPTKLTSLYHINKTLAHRPWTLKKDDFLHLTKVAGWSLSEVVHAVVLLAHFHALSSFIHGCGITPEIDFDKGHHIMDPRIGTGSPTDLQKSTPQSPQTHGTTKIGTSTGSDIISSTSKPITANSSPTRSSVTTTTSIHKIQKTELSSTKTGIGSGAHFRITGNHINSKSTGIITIPEKIIKSEVEILVATMKNLSETIPIEDPEEKKKRFETVASADYTYEKENLVSTVSANIAATPPDVSRFVYDADFTYEDFAKRGHVTDKHTFRIQDYSWEEHGFSLVNRLYADVGGYLDDKFTVAKNLTYYTMGGRAHIDTSKFRTAVWNYVCCLFGMRYDDYDYGEVNQLLERPLKSYIKTVCCYPERVTKTDYDNVMREFKHSEKVHVNLMIMEAKTQAELLYALRTITKFIL